MLSASSKQDYQDRVDALYDEVNEFLKQDNEVSKDERAQG